MSRVLPHTSQRPGQFRRPMMRAAALAAPRRLGVASAPVPEPGPGQLRVRLEGCGVCASNLPVWEGRPWFSYPTAAGQLGHEGWGFVDALGEGVEQWRAGQRVCFLSEHAYAQYDLAQADHVVALPRSLDEQPFPGEALGCAVNVLERLGPVEGRSVAVVGLGFLGTLVAALAAGQGARVTGLSRQGFARETASRMGVELTVPLEAGSDPAPLALEATGGEGFDVVVEATGSQAPLDLATRLVRTAGLLAIAGYHQDGPRQVDLQTWNWRGIDVVNAHERDPLRCVEGMRRAVQLVQRGLLDPSPLYSLEVPLEHLGRAFEALSVRRPGFFKALARMDLP